MRLEARLSSAVPHPIRRRFLAEELVRLRRAEEDRRYAASQRRGRIDPNPHQIDAVIFALRRLPEGGCILADEVGLGKTIEAGLVLAQRLAEGMQRALIIVPKPLLGQWQDELFSLFAIPSIDGQAEPERLGEAGVFIVGREFAGSERGSGLLEKVDPFELCVIDEAHEIFAGIHKRFDREGNYEEDSGDARMAHRVRSFLGTAGVTPVLLLTATPIQNSLAELWGLVQYVEPTGTLLGDLPTFREVFCDRDDRSLLQGQEQELRRRLNTVVQRTLRRQAQEFLERPFVERQTQLFEYTMSSAERELYEDVTRYLLDPTICAFSTQNALILISFHRRMASSVRALAASLRKVADRLQAELDGAPAEQIKQLGLDFALDLEEKLEGTGEGEDSDRPSAEKLRAELELVRSFIFRAESLPTDSKAQCLIRAVKLVGERGERGEGSGKVVVFTESLTTQDYIQELLLAHGGLQPGDITLFRGQNEGPRVQEALEHWKADVGDALPAANRPQKGIAVRLALVHEFKREGGSKVFISTEAGAKGLNLQFCDTIINYDLPWNPQRIEQRIGRCHRYSQERPVTVINFIATDNAAQRLTFEILSQKLDLFGKVLDASDQVLHSPNTDAPEAFAGALGNGFGTFEGFEKEMQRIYRRARSLEDIERELKSLRETVESKRKEYEQVQERTAALIESRFDDSVRAAFQRLQDQLPKSLHQLDQDVDALVSGYLQAQKIPHERREEGGRIFYDVKPSDALPEELREGVRAAVGHAKDLGDVEPLHLGHGLIAAAVEEARSASQGGFSLRYDVGSAPQPLADKLAPHQGSRGRLVVTKVRYAGFEPFERLLATVTLESGTDLPQEAAEALLSLNPESVGPLEPPLSLSPEDIDDAIEEAIFVDQDEVSQEVHERFERSIEQLERFLDDQVVIKRRKRLGVAKRLLDAQHRAQTSMGDALRTKAEADEKELQGELDELDSVISKLESREDPRYQRWRERAHQRRYDPPEITRLVEADVVIA